MLAGFVSLTLKGIMKQPFECPVPVPPELTAEVARARHLLLTTRNVALGTVNPDGTPRATVIGAVFVSSEDLGEPPLTAYSWSFPDTQHAQNLLYSEGKVALTLYKSFSADNACNLHGVMQRVTFGELPELLVGFNALRRERFRTPPRNLADFDPATAAFPKAFYRTAITGATVPVQRLTPAGEWSGDVRAELNLDWLRGFERDAWRGQWFREAASVLLRRGTRMPG